MNPTDYNLNSPLPFYSSYLSHSPYPPCPRCEKGVLLQRGDRVECVSCSYQKNLFQHPLIQHIPGILVTLLLCSFLLNPLNWGSFQQGPQDSSPVLDRQEEVS